MDPIQPQPATIIMQYLIGVLMAFLPAGIWGFVFYKKSPEKRKTVIISFVAGLLSVIPMFLWQRSWSFSFSFAGINIPSLNIYDFIRTLSHDPSPANIVSFIAITVAISLLIYVSSAVFVFMSDLIFGTKPKDAWRNITHRSIEEPLLFVFCGIITATLIWFSSVVIAPLLGEETTHKLIYISLWTSMMIGFLEEYTKHLVVRFADDHAIYSIDSAIEFSVIVALGFAFLENVLYFVDKIWLAPCSTIEIATDQCLLDPVKQVYIHQVGVLLVPFIFRSILSTLAHLVFSGIFGYFYGVAHFASYQLQAAEKKKWGMLFWGNLQKFFRGKTAFVFHEVKILQGLLFAMFFHGLFDFALDQEKTFITVPMLFFGYLYLNYLFGKIDSHKKLRLIIDEKTSNSKEYKAAISNVELLEKFEENFEKRHKKDKIDELQKNIELLDKYDKLIKKKKE